MARGISRGRVCTTTTTTTESRKMAAILQLIKITVITSKDIQPCFIASFFDTGHTCYGHLTPVKTKYLLTSITGTTAGFRLDRGLMSG